MAINFAVPEVSSSPYLLHFYHILVYPQFILLNILLPFFSSFVLLSTQKPLEFVQ